MEIVPDPGRAKSQKYKVHPFSELYRLLGTGVVLLKWPKGKKGERRRWKHLTADDMTQEYLRDVENHNIGVALGRVSRDLIAVDIDNDAFVEPFLACNPNWNDTLQTHGARGRVFWLRMDGKYPEKTVALKTQENANVGEWRGGNSQSIIYGIHPSGKPYEVLNLAEPLTTSFGAIVWPRDIGAPWHTLYLPNVTERQRHRDTEIPSHKGTEEPQEVEASIGGVRVRSIDDAVERAMPNRFHQNNDCLFTLARGVKSLELVSGAYSPRQLRDIFALWYARATEYTRKDQSSDDYLTQFLNAYSFAKYPLEDGPTITAAWKLAQEKPLPPEAVENFQDTDKRHVVALCRELQLMQGSRPFFLSARTLQRLLKHADHVTAARWLKSLCVLGIITEVEKGTGLKASRYRYLGLLQ